MQVRVANSRHPRFGVRRPLWEKGIWLHFIQTDSYARAWFLLSSIFWVIWEGHCFPSKTKRQISNLRHPLLSPVHTFLLPSIQKAMQHIRKHSFTFPTVTQTHIHTHTRTRTHIPSMEHSVLISWHPELLRFQYSGFKKKKRSSCLSLTVTVGVAY